MQKECNRHGRIASVCYLSTPGMHLTQVPPLMQALAESCQPPLVNKDFLLAANKVYGDTCYVLSR